MSRVHCVDCAAPVVVDPEGRCPEGHHVGARGARVEAAMGTDTAHPDEPEPWVYCIDREEQPALTASTNGHSELRPRELRPVRLPGLLADGFDDVPADADELLRELHSLSALDERVPPPPPVEPTPTAAVPTPPAPPTPPSTPPPPRPDRDAMSDAFAELTALDAFANERGRAAAATNGHGPSRNGHSGRLNGHAAKGDATPDGPVASTAAPLTPPQPTPEPAHDPSGHGEGLDDIDTIASLFFSDLTAPPVDDPVAQEPAHTAPSVRSDRLDDLFAAAVSAPRLRPRDQAAAVPGPATAPDAPTMTDAPPTAGATPQASEPHGSSPVPSDAATEPTPPPPAPAEPPAVTVDLTSFTAKGGAAHKAGRRKRFGR